MMVWAANKEPTARWPAGWHTPRQDKRLRQRFRIISGRGRTVSLLLCQVGGAESNRGAVGDPDATATTRITDSRRRQTCMGHVLNETSLAIRSCDTHGSG